VSLTCVAEDSPASCYCGETGAGGAQNRLMDGEETKAEEQPWVARLWLLYKNGRTTATIRCGGAIVSPKAVLRQGNNSDIIDRDANTDFSI
jgi:hypothetical protein